MINAILGSVALLATTALATEYGSDSVGSPGSAIVINQCSYEVYLENTPAADGGQTTVKQTLSSGGSYSQVYTALTNGNGWSIKLSQSAGSFGSNIMQYEYTYHPNEPIWYDLSEVDGNPWDGNWEITATDGCTPRQAAYRFSTDDAYGMQSCPVSSDITVTLCSGESGEAAPVPSSPAESSPWPTSAATPAPTSEAPAPTSEAPAPTSEAPPASTQTWGAWPPAAKNVEEPAGDAPEKELPAPTADAWTGPAITVTNLHYATVTEYVTAAAPAAKRHAHHPRHPHHRR